MKFLPFLARLNWRIGRRIYLAARGEQQSGAISENGEGFLQRCVVSHAAIDVPLVVLDIGANQGEWTAALFDALIDVGRSAICVHAFEPVPSTAEIFRTSIQNSEMGSCVKLHEYAMSSEPGHAEIAVYSLGGGTNTLHFESEGRSHEHRVLIELTTMAIFCDTQGIDHIHLAKCDTEGHDAWVLKGAAPLIEAGRVDVMQFEYNHRWIYGRCFLKDVFDLIDSLPYSLARVDEKHLTVFDEWHPELDRFFQSNYAIVHDRALGWFPLKRGHFDTANTYA